jgi:Na+/proline symporter
MNSILVAMSILAALFSGISYLAGPADVYKNGFGFAYVVLAFFIATPFTAIWMLPKFYQSRFYTAYQFLEERFALPVRLLASGLFIFRVALWLAAATYAPALAWKKSPAFRCGSPFSPPARSPRSTPRSVACGR